MCLSAFADDPWIITGDVVITEPMDVEDVIVAGSGSLTVRDVPEPGLRVTGNLFVVGNASIRLENSVIQFMSTYHGQYALSGIEESTIEVIGCDYRIPNQVQHALIIYGDGELVVEDTDFGDVQLISAGDARLRASRLTGNFEVLVQDDSTMELSDIPRMPGGRQNLGVGGVPERFGRRIHPADAGLRLSLDLSATGVGRHRSERDRRSVRGDAVADAGAAE